MAISEHGGIETWEWTDSLSLQYQEDFVKRYFVPYLNVVKFCRDKNAPGCFPDMMYKRLDGNDWANINTRNHPKVSLADGTHIAFNFTAKCFTNPNRCLAVQIDTNGSKKPNMVGYDVHEFSVHAHTGQILPSGALGEWDEETKTFLPSNSDEIRQQCKNHENVFTCTSIAVQDGFKINY